MPVLRAFLGWCVVVLWMSSAWAAETVPPLKLGIMPFNSTLALLKTHQPLARYLESQLQRPVVIYTAPDYYSFAQDLLEGAFDLAIAGPHFSVMAKDKGAVILFRYRADLQPVFVVRSEASVHTLSELRGKRIALSSPLSISSIGGLKWLNDQQLALGKDYQVLERSTHGAAIAAVAVGEADAAITTMTPLKQVPEDVRAQVRVLPLDIHVPHLMTLAHERLGKASIEHIRTALRQFPQTPEGQAFFQETGYQGYVDVSAQDVRALKPYIEPTKHLLERHK